MLDVAARVVSVSRSEVPVADQRFPRSCRLTARRQFLEVYRLGRKARRPALLVFGLPNEAGRCRLGITVTRKVGHAVVRNRIKRVLRDLFRRNQATFDRPMDLVVNAQRAVLTLPAQRIEREFLGAIAELAGQVGR